LAPDVDRSLTHPRAGDSGAAVADVMTIALASDHRFFICERRN